MVWSGGELVAEADVAVDDMTMTWIRIKLQTSSNAPYRKPATSTFLRTGSVGQHLVTQQSHGPQQPFC